MRLGDPAGRIADLLGVLGLYLFALHAWFHSARAAIGIALMLIACVIQARRMFVVAMRWPLAWAVVVSAGYVLARAGVAVLEDPMRAGDHLEDAIRLIYLSGFLVVAWWAAGDPRRVLIALALALAGFVLGRLEHFDFQATHQWWTSRQSFGLASEIAFGQYSAAAALGLSLMTPRFWRAVRSHRWRWVAAGLWGLLLLLMLQWVVISQSRGVWLALAVVAAGLMFAHRKRTAAMGWRRSLLIATVALALLSTLGYVNRDALLSRFGAEADSYARILSGDLQGVHGVNEDGSQRPVGLRVRMLLFGLEHTRDNVVFGSGPGVTRSLISEQGEASFRQFHDLHNAYLEVVLRLGLVGATLIGACLWLLGSESRQAYRRGSIDPDLYWVLVSAIALHLLVALTNFRMLNADWRFYWLLFGGALASFAIPPRRPTGGVG